MLKNNAIKNQKRWASNNVWLLIILNIESISIFSIIWHQLNKNKRIILSKISSIFRTFIKNSDTKDIRQKGIINFKKLIIVSIIFYFSGYQNIIGFPLSSYNIFISGLKFGVIGNGPYQLWSPSAGT